MYIYTFTRFPFTGMGITSCLGNTLDDVADSLYNAKSGLRLRTEFAELGIKSHVCGTDPCPEP